MKSSGPFRCLWPTLAAGCSAAYGQSVLAPALEPPPPEPTAATTPSETLVGSVGAPTLRRPSEAEVYPLRWGPAQFHPHLAYQFSYGDGLLQGPSSSEKTYINIVTPGLYVDIGRHWSLDFSIPFSEYSNPLFKDNTGYQVALAGRIPQDQWTFNFGYVSALTEEIQLETAAQDTLNSHLLSASAVRQLPGRLSLEVGLSQDIRLSEQNSDYWTSTSVNWLNYQATPKTALGFGVGGGYNLVDPGTDWFFEHLKARWVWQPGNKLNVQVTGGAQFVQFQDEDFSQEVFPLAGVSVLYRVRTGTTITVAASHSIENSLEAGQFVEQTSANVGLRQRLFEQFYLDVAPGYNVRSYDSSTTTPGFTNRDDDYFSVQAQLSTVLFKKLNAAVFYQFSDNQSTDDAFTFQSNQMGLRLAYRY